MAGKRKRKPGHWTKLFAAKPKPAWDGEKPGRRTLLNATKDDITAESHEHDHLIDGIDVEVLLNGIKERVKRTAIIKKRATKGRRVASLLAKEYVSMRDIAERMSQWVDEFELIRDAYKELMLQQFELEEISSTRLNTGQLIVISHIPHAVVNDKETFRQWCEDPWELDEKGERKSLPSLKESMHLHYGKTKELTTDMFESNKPLPPGVDVHHEVRVSVTGGD